MDPAVGRRALKRKRAEDVASLDLTMIYGLRLKDRNLVWLDGWQQQYAEARREELLKWMDVEDVVDLIGDFLQWQPAEHRMIAEGWKSWGCAACNEGRATHYHTVNKGCRGGD